MSTKIHVFCLLILVFTASCHAQGIGENECKEAFLYPIVTIEDRVEVEKVNELISNALTSLGLMAVQTKFYFEDSPCYVQVSWSTSTKILVVPYFAEQSRITVNDFSDMFQREINDQIEKSGLGKSLSASEEIILQD